MSYRYLTKKQANVIYAAYKCGDVTMSKATINKMYRMVGVADENYGHFDMACDHIINGRLDMAQAELDGKCTAQRTRCLREPIDVFELDIDSMTDEEFLAAFDDEGEYETYWVIL